MDDEVRAKRAELRKFLLTECSMERMAFIGVLDRSDAYALAAHIVECHAYPDAHGNQLWHPEARRCGDGWYCKDALELMQLKDEV